jgi:hypothetical protein
MATFDPDAYLAKKQEFDPDAYLANGQKSGGLMQDIGNSIAGQVRGAGSIGATLLAPKDALESFIARQMGAPELQVPDRRAAMTEGLRSMGADPESLLFKGNKLIAEILGSSGAGGGVANAITKVAPSVAAAVPSFINALRTGGLFTGAKAGPGVAGLAANMAPRIAGGAVAGGATAGLVNPEDAGAGALIGGALPPAVKAAGAVGSVVKQAAGGLVKNTLGVTTGAGGQAIGTAYQAGKQGSDDFLNNMRGNVPMEDVLGKAKAALSQMRQQRGEAYRSGMAAVSGDKAVIPFSPIEQAMSKFQSMGSYKGQTINKNAANTVDELADIVNRWKGLDPSEYHTPEGLDALKKAIGDVRDSLQYGTPGRTAADGIFNAVKKQITDQAPTYSKVMKDYSEASQLVGEIERTLSLKPGASVDAAMRKLQSLMRNNVNTNFGNRLDLAAKLEQQGGQSILDDIGGQALNSWTPRGLQAATSGGALLAAFPTGGASLAMLPAASPRLAGEVAYGLGAMNRGIGGAAASGRNQLAQLLAQTNSAPLAMNSLAPLLATGAVLSANQR